MSELKIKLSKGFCPWSIYRREEVWGWTVYSKNDYQIHRKQITVLGSVLAHAHIHRNAHSYRISKPFVMSVKCCYGHSVSTIGVISLALNFLFLFK